MSPVAGVLTQTRRAGGETFVGGGYLDATREIGRFLLTANGRADAWETFDAHELQGPIGGATTLDLRPSARGGITPSGRLGARWDFTDADWLRADVY